MTRREFLDLGLGIAALGIVPTAFCAADDDWKAAFRSVGFDPDAKGSSYFVVTADIHASGLHQQLAGHVAFWNALEPKPAFLAALGDFGCANRGFGHRPTLDWAMKSAGKDFAVVSEILTDGLRKDVPRIYVVGNHDTFIGDDGRQVWRKHFPDQPTYCVQDFCGIRFMKWDGACDGSIDAEQERWILKECAAYPKDRTLVILVHQPSVGSVSAERGVSLMVRRALAGRTGQTWVLAGHIHGNRRRVWDLPGGGQVHEAAHTRDIDGWWAYGVRDGQIVASIYKDNAKMSFVPHREPIRMASRGPIPVPFEGRTDIVWSCFVGDAEEIAARVSLDKVADNVTSLIYIGKMRYRFPKAKVAPQATAFAILGGVNGNVKTKEPDHIYFSADGENWTEVFRRECTASVNVYPLPAELVGAKDLHLRFESYRMQSGDNVSGYAFLAIDAKNVTHSGDIQM